MRGARSYFIAVALSFAACGRAPPAPPSPYMHSPPISKLTPEQLHALSDACQKYPDTVPARGPYDAKYCADAIAAWSDSPIQMLPFRPQNEAPNSPARP